MSNSSADIKYTEMVYLAGTEMMVSVVCERMRMKRKQSNKSLLYAFRYFVAEIHKEIEKVKQHLQPGFYKFQQHSYF